MLFISDSPGFFILFGKDALATMLANIRQEAIKFYINKPNSPPIYYFQRLRYNPLDHEFELTSKVHLDGAFTLKPVWDKNLTELRRVRISQIIDVEGVEYTPGQYSSPAEYLHNWGRNLP